jgi:hypothetical protein
MADLALSKKKYCHKVALFLTVVAFFLWIVAVQNNTMAADDAFQRAISYVFTGKIDPKDGPEIVDRESCIVVDPSLNSTDTPDII